MTGPEHYRKAEQLLANVALDFDHPKRAVRQEAKHNLAAAQVHATLALAAATAAEQATAYDGDEDHARSRGWAGVA